jgi:hypothetical protein
VPSLTITQYNSEPQTTKNVTLSDANLFSKDPLPTFIDLEKSKLQHELAAQGAPLLQIAQDP